MPTAVARHIRVIGVSVNHIITVDASQDLPVITLSQGILLPLFFLSLPYPSFPHTGCLHNMRRCPPIFRSPGTAR